MRGDRDAYGGGASKRHHRRSISSVEWLLALAKPRLLHAGRHLRGRADSKLDTHVCAMKSGLMISIAAGRNIFSKADEVVKPSANEEDIGAKERGYSFPSVGASAACFLRSYVPMSSARASTWPCSSFSRTAFVGASRSTTTSRANS